MFHKVTSQAETRAALSKGVSIIAGAVRVTLGPSGRNVIIKRGRGIPHITKDGVTVAKSITLKDPMEEAGARLVKEVALKAASDAGDGTTTATILADALYQAGSILVAKGSNAIHIQRGIAIGAEMLTAELGKMAIPVETQEMAAHVALVSSNWDEEVGGVVAKAIESVGLGGIVTIEASDNPTTSLLQRQGFAFERGWVNPNFSFIEGEERPFVQYGDALVIITDAKLQNLAELMVLVNVLMTQKRPIILIADDIAGDALAALVSNHRKGHGVFMAVRAPGFGKDRLAWLQDLAAACECQVLSDAIGVPWKDLRNPDKTLIVKAFEKVTGQASFHITGETTMIVGVTEEPRPILAAHLATLQRAVETETSEYKKGELQDRLARIGGKVALIQVGGGSEPDVMEKTDRFDDALAATRAAIEEGVVAGGGAALLHAVHAARAILAGGLTGSDPSDGDTMAGIKLLFDVVSAPFRQLASNCGVDGAELIAARIAETGDTKRGYDFVKNESCDLVAAGIIDPVKVTRVALNAAASIAGLLLTTEVMITDDET